MSNLDNLEELLLKSQQAIERYYARSDATLRRDAAPRRDAALIRDAALRRDAAPEQYETKDATAAPSTGREDANLEAAIDASLESHSATSTSDMGEEPTKTRTFNEYQAKDFIKQSLKYNQSLEDTITNLTMYYTPERKRYTEDEARILVKKIQVEMALELSASETDVASEEADVAIGRMDNPFTVPNNGRALLSNGIEVTYMCFWISLADGLNHFKHNERTDWSWYELRGMLGNQINGSGELLEISPPAGDKPGGKHQRAFEEIAKKLKVKIKVYTLLRDKTNQINYIDIGYRVESSNDSDVVIEILALGAHYEFIAGFGHDGGHSSAVKLAYTDRDDELTKEFMINDIYKRLRDRNINFREKYLKYKMKYLKLKKSLE